MRRVLFGIVWFVVFYIGGNAIVAGIVVGFSVGESASQYSPPPKDVSEGVAVGYKAGVPAGEAFARKYGTFFLLGALVLSVAGTAAGILPGTKPKPKAKEISDKPDVAPETRQLLFGSRAPIRLMRGVQGSVAFVVLVWIVLHYQDFHGMTYFLMMIALPLLMLVFSLRGLIRDADKWSPTPMSKQQHDAAMRLALDVFAGKVEWRKWDCGCDVTRYHGSSVSLLRPCLQTSCQREKEKTG